MKKFGMNLIATSLLCLMTVGTALAQERFMRQINTFNEDVLVGNTIVKAGTYTISFDADNNKITVLRGRRVMASARATLEMGDVRARRDSVAFVMTDLGKKLDRITFAGHFGTVIITGDTSSGGQ